MSEQTSENSFIEAYHSYIPTIEDVVHKPEPFLTRVRGLVKNLNEVHDRFLAGLEISEQTPDLNGLLKGDVVLAKSFWVKNLSNSREDFTKLQLVATAVRNTRIALRFDNVHDVGGKKPITTRASTVFHRTLFDEGFPVAVGSLREGPHLRSYRNITGGDVKVDLLESNERFALASKPKSDTKVSGLDNETIVVRSTDGVIRAWSPT